jgi:phage tail protein X
MGGYYYTTRQGDMWDYIAWKVYNDETLAGILMTATENRELIDTYIFSAGTNVWCPKTDDTSAVSGTAPWRDNG